MRKWLLQSYYCITYAYNIIDILFNRKFSLNVILFITNRTIITGNWKEFQPKDGFLLGPYRVWYSNFAPIHKNTSILSRIEFNRKGFIYKFEGLKYWSYEPSGRQWKGGQNGEDLKYPQFRPVLMLSFITERPTIQWWLESVVIGYTVANRPGMTGTIPERASLSRVPANK